MKPWCRMLVVLGLALIPVTGITADDDDLLSEAYRRAFTAARDQIVGALEQGDFSSAERWLVVVEHELDSLKGDKRLSGREIRTLEEGIVKTVFTNLSTQLADKKNAFTEAVVRGDVRDAEWQTNAATHVKAWRNLHGQIGQVKWRGKAFLPPEQLQDDMMPLLTGRVVEQFREDLVLTGRLLKNFKKITAQDAFLGAKRLRDWSEGLGLVLPDELVRSYDEREARLARLLKQAEAMAGHGDAISRLRALTWAELEPEACARALDALVLIKERWGESEVGLEPSYRDLRAQVKGRLETVLPRFSGPDREGVLQLWRAVFNHKGIATLFVDTSPSWENQWQDAHRHIEYRIKNGSGVPVRINTSKEEFWVLPHGESRLGSVDASRKRLVLPAVPYEMTDAYLPQEFVLSDLEQRRGKFVEWEIKAFVAKPVPVMVMVPESHTNSVVEMRGEKGGGWSGLSEKGVSLIPGTYRFRLRLPDHVPIEREIDVLPGDTAQVVEWTDVVFEANAALVALGRLREDLHRDDFLKKYGSMSADKRGVVIEQLSRLAEERHKQEASMLLAEMEDRLLRNRSQRASAADDVLKIFRSYPYQVAVYQGWKNYDRPQKLRDEAGVLGAPPLDALLDEAKFENDQNDPVAQGVLRSRFALWSAYIEEKTGPDRSMQRKYAGQFKALGQRWVDRFPVMARQCFYDALALEVDSDTRLSFTPGAFEKLIHGYLGGRTFPKGYKGIGPEDPELMRIGSHLNYYARGTSSKKYLSLMVRYLEIEGMAESPVQCNEFDVLLLLNYFINIHGGSSDRDFSRAAVTPEKLGGILSRLDSGVSEHVAERLIRDADEATSVSEEARKATRSLVTMVAVLLAPEHPLARKLRMWRQETPGRAAEFVRAELGLRRRWLPADARKKMVGLTALSIYESGTGKNEVYVAVAGKTGLDLGGELTVYRAGKTKGRIKLAKVFRSEGWPEKPTLFEVGEGAGLVQRGDSLSAGE